MKKIAKEPVSVSLKEDRIVLRAILLGALIIIIFICVGVFVSELSTKQTGWTKITASSSEIVYCDEDFTFEYYLGSGSKTANEDYREIQSLYKSSMELTYKLFNVYQAYEDVNNLYYINANPNTEIEVDSLLYTSFLQMRGKMEYLLLGPINSIYENLFNSYSLMDIEQNDPINNHEVSSIVSETLSYLSDVNHVSLSLLGNNTVRLNISTEFKDYLSELNIDHIIDFSWMRNAFIIDYLASELKEKGYTYGHLSTSDGFFVNLGDESTFTNPLIDINETVPTVLGTFTIPQGAINIVQLRTMIFYESDKNRCMKMLDGTYRTLYIDPKDGTSKYSLPTLTCISSSNNCSELVIKMLDIYISDTFDVSLLEDLQERAIYSIWRIDEKIYYNLESIEYIPRIEEYLGEFVDE